MKRCILAVALALSGTFAGAQVQPAPARDPLSPALQDYFYKQIREWDQGPVSPTAPSRAFADIDFQTKVRPQLTQAGTAAFPLAPKVADLMVSSEKNRYTMAYMVMGMTPTPDAKDIPAILGAAGGPAGERMVALAQLGRSSSRDGLELLKRESRSPDLATRLMATVALAYAALSFPDDVPLAVAANLKDADRPVRTASINGLRLMGRLAAPAAPQVIDYLRTRESPYQAAAVLKNLPLDAVRPAKSDIEAVVADPRLTAFQKEDAVALLMRLEMEK